MAATGSTQEGAAVTHGIHSDATFTEPDPVMDQDKQNAFKFMDFYAAEKHMWEKVKTDVLNKNLMIGATIKKTLQTKNTRIKICLGNGLGLWLFPGTMPIKNDMYTYNRFMACIKLTLCLRDECADVNPLADSCNVNKSNKIIYNMVGNGSQFLFFQYPAYTVVSELINYQTCRDAKVKVDLVMPLARQKTVSGTSAISYCIANAQMIALLHYPYRNCQPIGGTKRRRDEMTGFFKTILEVEQKYPKPDLHGYTLSIAAAFADKNNDLHLFDEFDLLTMKNTKYTPMVIAEAGKMHEEVKAMAKAAVDNALPPGLAAELQEFLRAKRAAAGEDGEDPMLFPDEAGELFPAYPSGRALPSYFTSEEEDPGTSTDAQALIRKAQDKLGKPEEQKRTVLSEEVVLGLGLKSPDEGAKGPATDLGDTDSDLGYPVYLETFVTNFSAFYDEVGDKVLTAEAVHQLPYKMGPASAMVANVTARKKIAEAADQGDPEQAFLQLADKSPNFKKVLDSMEEYYNKMAEHVDAGAV